MSVATAPALTVSPASQAAVAGTALTYALTVATVFATVSSSAGAPAGTYGLALSARDVLHASHGGSLPASYVVQALGDHTAPTAPANLTASVMSKQKQVQLSWLSATDNVGVTGHRVLRDGVVAATVTAPDWTDTNYIAGATRTYAVIAVGAAGNVSPSSNIATVTLPGGSGRKR